MFTAKPWPKQRTLRRVGLAGLFCVVPSLLILTGCGSGGDSNLIPITSPSATPTATSGRATLTIAWPSRSRATPYAAESIVVRISRTGVDIGQQILRRPENGGDTSASFDLPTGDVFVTATAYPNADGTGVAQARAEVGVGVVGGQTASLRLTLSPTIDHIEITPANPAALIPGGTVQLAATAINGAGEIVMTNKATVTWRSKSPDVAAVQSEGLVTAVGFGQVVIEAVETESGKTGTATVTVTPAPSPTPTPIPDPTRRLALITGDLVYSPQTGRIIASLPSTAGASGNSIASIDPQTLAVGGVIYVGSEPKKLALSDNNTDLYVALDGSASVRRVNLSTGAVGDPFTVGERDGPLYAEDMAVMPGDPNVVALSRRSKTYSPGDGGVAIYDNGVPRPTTTPYYTAANVIEWGVGNRIYGYNTESTEFGFRRLEVSASGVSVVDVKQLLSGFDVDMVYSDGRIYATSGAIINPEAGTLVGTLNMSGLICPDAALHRVWVLSTPPDGSGNATLKAYNTDTLLEVGSVTLPNISGTTASLIRWGSTGLAFRTSAGQVILISNAPGL